MAWNNEGGSLQAQGKHDEAIQAYDKSIELDPKLGRAGTIKGRFSSCSVKCKKPM